MKIARIAIALTLLGGVAVACSSTDNGGAVQTPPASTSPTPTTTSAQPAVTTTDDLKFVPASLVVKAGTEVVWTIGGSITHTVTAQSGATFDSGNLLPGQKFKQTFSAPGTIKYFCKIHGQSMSGTITVIQ